MASRRMSKNLRRRLESDAEGRDRWLVSYADFITLLFAFFVVMYSISSVNEGKYKVLSETLEGVFNESERSMEPIQVGEHRRISDLENNGNNLIKPIFDREQPTPKEFPKEDDPSLELERLAGEFNQTFEDLIFEEHLVIEQKENWIEIALDDSVVFGRGDREPLDAGLEVLERIARILAPMDNVMMIQGHTDNIPVRGQGAFSNWELSALRAAIVVKYLSLEGIAPERMSAVGFGEHKPVASNGSVQGRRKNRRIVILVSKDNQVHSAFSPR